MTGQKLINMIESREYKKGKGRNSMGCLEAYYDPCYLIYKAFEDKDKLEELRALQNIDNLILVAEFATSVFY